MLIPPHPTPPQTPSLASLAPQTIVNFISRGQFAFASYIIAMVSTSMMIQMLLVYLNGRKRGPKRYLREMLIVFCGMKPAVDAYRVISGAKAHKDDAWVPAFELILAKTIEIVAESIPSSLVQIYALILSDNPTTASFLSVVIS